MEADLIEAGLRLRDCPSKRFTWRDLKVFVKFVGVDSHIYRAKRPEEAGWGRTEQLLAMAVDELRWLHYAKTQAAADGRPPPPRLPRPGIKDAAPEARPGSKVKPMTIDRAREVFGREDADPDRTAKLHKLFRTAG